MRHKDSRCGRVLTAVLWEVSAMSMCGRATTYRSQVAERDFEVVDGREKGERESSSDSGPAGAELVVEASHPVRGDTEWTWR